MEAIIAKILDIIDDFLREHGHELVHLGKAFWEAHEDEIKAWLIEHLWLLAGAIEAAWDYLWPKLVEILTDLYS